MKHDKYLQPRDPSRFPPIGPLATFNIITGKLIAENIHVAFNCLYDVGPYYTELPHRRMHYSHYQARWEDMTELVRGTIHTPIIVTQSYEFIKVGAWVLSEAGVDFRMFRPVVIDGKPECTIYEQDVLIDSIRNGWEVR